MEAICEVLEYVEAEIIEQEYMPKVQFFLKIENHSQPEFTESISLCFGKIVHKLAKVGLLKPYLADFLAFFNTIKDHDEEKIRKLAVYNLPGLHLLFKPFKGEVDVDWPKEYQTFLEDDSKIRKAAAKSLHEAFLLVEADEDSTVLRDCLHDLMTDGTKKILSIIN